MMRRVTRSDDSGAELIELAIVLPLLMLVFAAIIDFGFLFQRFEVVTNAAREGARLGSLIGYSVPDVQARVREYLTASGLTVTTEPTTVQCQDVTLAGYEGKTVKVVKVTVEYPATFLALGPMAALAGGGGTWSTMTLRSASTMRLENQSSPICP
jgi:Flp pilus assembly protein TadG